MTSAALVPNYYFLTPKFDMLMLMQPSQPTMPQGPPSNPYDFITNPGQPAKKPVFGGGSPKSRIILIGGGIILLLIIISVVGSLLSSAGQGDAKSLKNLVAQQEELARVATLGADKAQDASTRSLAYTVKLSVASQQQKLIAHLSKNNVKISKEELAAKKKQSVDTELDAATSSNRFDEAFSQVLSSELANYSRAVESLYQTTGSQTTKDILSEAYTSSSTLLSP